MNNRFRFVEAFVTIVDEDGGEGTFSVGEVFDVGDTEYEILVPLDKEDEGFLFRVEYEGDEAYFVGVTDKEEERVAMEAYEAQCKEDDE